MIERFCNVFVLLKQCQSLINRSVCHMTVSNISTVILTTQSTLDGIYSQSGRAISIYYIIPRNTPVNWERHHPFLYYIFKEKLLQSWPYHFKIWLTLSSDQTWICVFKPEQWSVVKWSIIEPIKLWSHKTMLKQYEEHNYAVPWVSVINRFYCTH